ncbi:hypothetical protein LTR37_004663 [Vermiconidia calcicola]|uniref:Uncharacterized protein n=1 Tax=Vermiconidia calcicola TaxID=1690605 RepID=A0ACC3NLF7_9PEZI|nr:hypothetical protein LTR37_004663 [Vermiconidia calcicola]
MVDSPLTDSVLSKLQSKDQVELLDAVDRLRLDGFQGELNLPQLIVCGDQSSGKSSVLEAISRVRFPSAEQFSTCFATELVLRRAQTSSFFVNIVPASHRPEEDKKILQDFKSDHDLGDLHNFASVVDAAKCLIAGLPSSNNHAFYEDKLVAHINRPDLPPLTLVDLPGLIHSSNNEQGRHDIALVRRLVNSYMTQESSIILAVVAADNRIANQVVMELAKEVDPSGQRTLGIITKPDKVDAGSASEAKGIECAQNLNIHLGLGWHVLKNRDSSQSSAYNWKHLDARDLGANNLRQKLSLVLFGAIQKNLPSLVRDIKDRVTTCETNLARLGESKETEIEQRLELSTISFRLHNLIEAAVQGVYRDPFFDLAGSPMARERRLRSRIREVLDDFANHMRNKGQRYDFLDSSMPSPPASWSALTDFPSCGTKTQADSEPEVVTFQAAMAATTDHIKTNRGCELDGQYPSDVMIDIFRDQSCRWHFITDMYMRKSCDAVAVFLQEAISYIAPRHIVQNFGSSVFGPYLGDATLALERKIEELLRPYTKGTLITLNTRAYHVLKPKVKSNEKQRNPTEVTLRIVQLRKS